jgi:peptidoglycan/xylan/chitin deacetylase (PgdA/CDA1 family)
MSIIRVQMSKTQFLADLLYHSGLLRPISFCQPKQTVVLTYHRIRPDRRGEESLLQDQVFGPTQAAFEQQMKWLKQNFEVLSESELLATVLAPKYRGRYAAITFDDGYRDNYDLAYPVLRAHSLPAIFFVCPGLLDARQLGWWDLIAYFIKQSERPSIELFSEVILLEARKEEAIAKLNDWMKERPHTATANLMEALSKACEVPFPDREFQDRQLMTWEQVREVSKNGVAVGSHTSTHPVLATLDETSQRRELAESKSALEQKLNSTVRTLAYPVGSYRNFTAATMRIARECGYEAAFSFHSGGNIPGTVNSFNVRRIAAPDRLNSMFACGAVMPEWFTWAQALPPHLNVAN